MSRGVKQPPPVQATTAPTSPPKLTRSGIAGGPNAAPQSPHPTPPLPNLIINQPLPTPNTGQYEQTQAMYEQALAQLKASQSAQMAMQAQLNRLAATNPTAGLMQRMMGMYQGDPYAAERAAMNAKYATPQRLSMAFQGAGY